MYGLLIFEMDEELTLKMLEMFGGTIPNSLKDLLNIGSENGNDDDDEISTFFINSPYYDLDSLNKFCKKNQENCSMFSLNVQSINSKISSLKGILQGISDKFNFLFSAICIQESWLSETESVELLKIPNYKLFHKPRSISQKSGLMIYLHTDYNGKESDLFKPS